MQAYWRKPCNLKTLAHIAHLAHGIKTTQPKGILLEGEGVGPTAKGQQKRSVCKQFLFFKK
jgi:hypothetical protein